MLTELFSVNPELFSVNPERKKKPEKKFWKKRTRGTLNPENILVIQSFFSFMDQVRFFFGVFFFL